MITVTHIVLHGCTVVQDQCSIATLYCRITSLPVHPSTIHGHCNVVLDTSNISILHCTTRMVNKVYCSKELFYAKQRLLKLVILNNDSARWRFREDPAISKWSFLSGSVFRHADGSATAYEPLLQAWLTRPASTSTGQCAQNLSYTLDRPGPIIHLGRMQ